MDGVRCAVPTPRRHLAGHVIDRRELLEVADALADAQPHELVGAVGSALHLPAEECRVAGAELEAAAVQGLRIQARELLGSVAAGTRW